MSQAKNEDLKSKTQNVEKEEYSLSYIRFILLSLYSLQGLIIGLFLDYYPLKLKEYFNYSELGVYTIISYPFGLKIFWSPLVDAYYHKSIGKRKTWIIYSQSIIILSLIFLWFYLDSIIESRRIYTLSFTICFIFFLLATQDIAVDGLALSICHKYPIVASSSQTIGHILGMTISNTIFSHLNSTEFSSKYFGLQTRPLIEIPEYLIVLALFYLLATILTIYFDEREDQMTEDQETLSNIMSRLKQMANKPVLRYLFLITLIRQIGFAFSNKVVPLIFTEKGYPIEYTAFMSTIKIPCLIYISYYMEKYTSNFSRLIMVGFKYRIFVCVIEMVFLMVFSSVYSYTKELSGGWFLLDITNYIMIFISLLFSITYGIMTNSNGGFMNQIADRSIGSTYLTALNSINNMSYKLPSFLAFYCVDIFGFHVVGWISILLSICYYVMLKDQYERYDRMPLSEWSCNEDDAEAKKK